MPPPDTHPHSAFQKAEHTLGQLLVLFGASVLIVFILQIPQSQARTGEGNKYCVGTMKCKYGGNPNKPTSKCEKKEKKVGIPGKPCKEKGNSGKYFTGKCIKTLDCKTTKTDKGEKPKKADSKSGEKGGEPKIPDMKPPESKPKPPKEPQKDAQNQLPCPANPNLKQGTPECEAATKTKGSTNDSIWRKLMDLAN